MTIVGQFSEFLYRVDLEPHSCSLHPRLNIELYFELRPPFPSDPQYKRHIRAQIGYPKSLATWQKPLCTLQEADFLQFQSNEVKFAPNFRSTKDWARWIELRKVFQCMHLTGAKKSRLKRAILAVWSLQKYSPVCLKQGPLGILSTQSVLFRCLQYLGRPTWAALDKRAYYGKQ